MLAARVSALLIETRKLIRVYMGQPKGRSGKGALLALQREG